VARCCYIAYYSYCILVVAVNAELCFAKGTPNVLECCTLLKCSKLGPLNMSWALLIEPPAWDLVASRTDVDYSIILYSDLVATIIIVTHFLKSSSVSNDNLTIGTVIVLELFLSLLSPVIYTIGLGSFGCFIPFLTFAFSNSNWCLYYLSIYKFLYFSI